MVWLPLLAASLAKVMSVTAVPRSSGLSRNLKVTDWPPVTTLRMLSAPTSANPSIAPLSLFAGGSISIGALPRLCTATATVVLACTLVALMMWAMPGTRRLSPTRSSITAPKPSPVSVTSVRVALYASLSTTNPAVFTPWLFGSKVRIRLELVLASKSTTPPSG